MKKYMISFDPSVGPEDAESGRHWEVVHTQAWQDGRWLPPLAQRCTKVDAQRIADCLNACEGVLAENVDVNGLIQEHALLKIAYNNLRVDGLGHLRALLRTMNTRGEYTFGGCDYSTERGEAYRDAVMWLAFEP